MFEANNFKLFMLLAGILSRAWICPVCTPQIVLYEFLSEA